MVRESNYVTIKGKYRKSPPIVITANIDGIISISDGKNNWVKEKSDKNKSRDIAPKRLSG